MSTEDAPLLALLEARQRIADLEAQLRRTRIKQTVLNYSKVVYRHNLHLHNENVTLKRRIVRLENKLKAK